MHEPVAHAPGAGSTGPRLQPPTPRVALTIASATLLVLVLLAAAPAVKPFLLGVVLVYLMGPLVDLLASRGVPRALAVLLVFLLSLAIIAGVLALALTPLVTQLRQFITDLPDIVAGARGGLDGFYESLDLAPEVRASLDDALVGALTSVSELDLGAIVAPLVDSLVAVVSTITAYAILPAWLFYLLKDRVRLADSLHSALPPSWRGDVFATFVIANRVFGNWIRGQLVLGLTVGIASYVGLMVLSAVVDPVFGRYAVLLAIIAGLLELVPFIGPIIAAVPAVLIGLTAGPAGFLAALILYLIIQQVENNILVPKIQGDAIELHPSAVMLALVIGAALGGVLGAIVSLPVAAAARDLFRFGFARTGDPPASVEEALARISPALPPKLRRDARGPGASADERLVGASADAG